MPKLKICPVLLAAGGSERFNGDKLGEKIFGKSILELSLENALKYGEVIVVVNDKFERILPANCKIVVNSEWQRGISTSVKLAVNIAIEKNCDAILFFLADMPFVNEICADAVIGAWKQNPNKGIVYTTCGGVKGFPTLVSRELFNEIMSITGDSGFRKIIKKYPEQTLAVPVDHAGCCFDIDSREDLEKVKNIITPGS